MSAYCRPTGGTARGSCHPRHGHARLRRAVLSATLVIATACRQAESPGNDVEALLTTQTQELLDAVGSGNRAPWQRHLLDDAVFITEDGALRTKTQMVEDLRPLPAGISGQLRVTDFRVARRGSTAVTTYIAQEDETYFGQAIKASYRTSDTWVRTDTGWRLLASHVLAMRSDPPARSLPLEALREYEGVYALTPEITYTVHLTDAGLTGTRLGREPEPLRVEVPDMLFVPGQPRIRKVFERDGNGHITGFVDRREMWDITWRRRDP